MLDTSKDDDRAVVYFQLCPYGHDLVLDWDALSSRAGLNIVALAAIGLDEQHRSVVRSFVRRPTREQLGAVVQALKHEGARFNAQTRKEVVDAIERSMGVS